MAKASKVEANYQNEASGKQQCGGCVMFEAPASCSDVAGTISPHGHCRFYRPKPSRKRTISG